MNAKIRVTLHYFLKVLERRLSDEKPQVISPFFLKVFTREQLLEILSWLHNGNIPKTYCADDMDSKEILQAIADERSILMYILWLWEQEQQAGEFTAQNVRAILSQLRLHTHYLAEKPIAHWDGYDKGNFRALLQKAGREIPRYGIFDADVKEQDKHCCTTPAKGYPSLWEAEAMLALLIAQGGFSEGELKVMEL